MTTTPKCRRGHNLTGHNAMTANHGGVIRCRACRRATDRARYKPELKDQLQQLSDDAYRDILTHGINGRPGPRPKPTKTPTTRTPATPTAPKGDVNTNEVIRLMPFGAKRWLMRALEEQLQPADIPESMHPWLTDYDLIRPSHRTGDLIFSERARKIMRQLQARFAGKE